MGTLRALGAFLKILPKNPLRSTRTSASVPDAGSASSSSSSSSARFLVPSIEVDSASSARVPLSLRLSTSFWAASICAATSSSVAMRPLVEGMGATTGMSTLTSVVSVVMPVSTSVERVWRMETPEADAPERAEGPAFEGVAAGGEATRWRLVRGERVLTGDCEIQRRVSTAQDRAQGGTLASFSESTISIDSTAGVGV